MEEVSTHVAVSATIRKVFIVILLILKKLYVWGTIARKIPKIKTLRYQRHRRCRHEDTNKKTEKKK